MGQAISKTTCLTALTIPQKKKLADAREALAKAEAEKGTTTLLGLANAKANVVKELPGLTPMGFKVAITCTASDQEMPMGKAEVDFKLTDSQRDAIAEEVKLRKARAKANSKPLAKAVSSFFGTNGVEMLDIPRVRIADKGMDVTAKGRLKNFQGTNGKRVGVKAMAEIAGG